MEDETIKKFKGARCKISAPFETIKRQKTASQPSFLMFKMNEIAKMLYTCGISFVSIPVVTGNKHHIRNFGKYIGVENVIFAKQILVK